MRWSLRPVIFGVEKSNVSVHNLHFMVCVPLRCTAKQILKMESCCAVLPPTRPNSATPLPSNGSMMKHPFTLVAPYCAIPRDYLSDTPLLRAMGFLVSQHGQLGAIPPPPFLSDSPWRACEVEVRYPPP